MGARALKADRKRIGIVGAGFTGTMLAVQLVERCRASIDVFLFDRSVSFARGVAYATTNDRHLLNVAAANMGAYDGDPGHFSRWLQQEGNSEQGGAFVPRRLYGDYLTSIVEQCGGIEKIAADVREVDVDGQGVSLRLSDDRRFQVDHAVLCVGNFPPASPAGSGMARSRLSRYVADPWTVDGLAGIDSHAAVVLLGTGLTMVDVVLELDARGHRGPVVALSRRGLLPAAHKKVRPARHPLTLDRLPGSMTALFRVVREAARNETTHGGDWRAIVDSLRPHAQKLWRRLPVAERGRFLRHARPYWDIHRHRLAPKMAEDIAGLQRVERLKIIAGRLNAVDAAPDGVRLSIRKRLSGDIETINAGWVVNCTGPALDYSRIDDPLLTSLFSAGLVRRGSLSLGLDVDDDYRLIDAAGGSSPRLFALGPPIRGSLWETTAVPDIRAQCAALAARLVGS